MILTICANPSMDCTIELDSLNVGMLNRIQSKTRTYAGKALNVAVGIGRLSGDSLATGFMFRNDAEMFERRLKEENVKYNFVYNEGDVRVNYKIIDNRSMLTEINDKGDAVSRENQLKLIELVKTLSKDASIVVMSGSLPQNVESSFYGEVLSAVPAKVKKIADAEKHNLESALNQGLYMIKPNLAELEAFFEKKMYSKADVIEACKHIFYKYDLKTILVSLGEEGAILTDGNKHYYAKTCNVAVNSKVGAGDSMIAAACLQIEQNAPLEQVLRCSVAAGTAAITTKGTELFYRDKYEEILEQVMVEQIK